MLPLNWRVSEEFNEVIEFCSSLAHAARFGWWVKKQKLLPAIVQCSDSGCGDYDDEEKAKAYWSFLEEGHGGEFG